MSMCPHCKAEFEPKRADQVYCGKRCRLTHNEERRGDGALRGAVSSVRVLRRGNVSVVLRFLPVDRDNASQLTPGTLVEILR